MNNNIFSLGGEYGLVLSGKGITLGGSNGLVATSDGIRAGGKNGLSITGDGIFAGGSSEFSITADGITLGGYGITTGGTFVTPNAARSFGSFSALKRYLGSPGTGNQWHHIVEQTPGNIQRFGAEAIHTTDNVVAIPASVHVGKGSISAFYSSIQPGTGGLTVRRWLSTQSLAEQRQYGLDVLKKFGE